MCTWSARTQDASATQADGSARATEERLGRRHSRLRLSAARLCPQNWPDSAPIWPNPGPTSAQLRPSSSRSWARSARDRTQFGRTRCRFGQTRWKFGPVRPNSGRMRPEIGFVRPNCCRNWLGICRNQQDLAKLILESGGPTRVGAPTKGSEKTSQNPEGPKFGRNRSPRARIWTIMGASSHMTCSMTTLSGAWLDENRWNWHDLTQWSRNFASEHASGTDCRPDRWLVGRPKFGRPPADFRPDVPALLVDHQSNFPRADPLGASVSLPRRRSTTRKCRGRVVQLPTWWPYDEAGFWARSWRCIQAT